MLKSKKPFISYHRRVSFKTNSLKNTSSLTNITPSLCGTTPHDQLHSHRLLMIFEQNIPTGVTLTMPLTAYASTTNSLCAKLMSRIQSCPEFGETSKITTPQYQYNIKFHERKYYCVWETITHDMHNSLSLQFITLSYFHNSFNFS